MPPGRRRRKRSVVLSSATVLLSLIRMVMKMEEEEKKQASCKLRQLCKMLKLPEERIGSIDRVLWRWKNLCFNTTFSKCFYSIYTSGVDVEKQPAISEMVINSCAMRDE